jgi:hypothetical protein
MNNYIPLIIKIQKLYRKNKCIKLTKELTNLNLITLSKNIDFEKFKKTIIDKKINNIFIKVCKAYNNYKKINLNNRVLTTLFFFYLYPNDLLSSRKNNLDFKILELSKLFINNITTSDINLLCNILNEYNNVFKVWSDMDKNRLVEDCIISYYFKCEHLEKIKNNELIKKPELHNTEQINEMITELEKQKKDLLINITFIDKTFDIEYFKINYKEIYNNIINTKHNIELCITDTMKLAYYNMICEDIKKGDMILTMNLIKDIGDRLIIICPTKNKELFKNKFNNENITDLLIDQTFNPILNKFIFMIIDFIILMDAPIHDVSNKEFKHTIKVLIENSNNFSKTLPQILITINEHIDRLYQLLLNND